MFRQNYFDAARRWQSLKNKTRSQAKNNQPNSSNVAVPFYFRVSRQRPWRTVYALKSKGEFNVTCILDKKIFPRYSIYKYIFLRYKYTTAPEMPLCHNIHYKQEFNSLLF